MRRLCKTFCPLSCFHLLVFLLFKLFSFSSISFIHKLLPSRTLYEFVYIYKLLCAFVCLPVCLSVCFQLENRCSDRFQISRIAAGCLRKDLGYKIFWKFGCGGSKKSRFFAAPAGQATGERRQWAVLLV